MLDEGPQHPPNADCHNEGDLQWRSYHWDPSHVVEVRSVELNLIAY
jgi:hypothetical protein